MCTCYRNFQGADCSERTCPFGLAHVDTPKGDVDMSGGELTTSTVIPGSTVYPFGTEEQFPMMADTDGNVLSKTAHYYMECSNKGLCDRKEGECECFDGYEGHSCQRASCPEGCSGHGTCEHIETLAGDVIYALWDTGMTMGCRCDAGYTGPDCSGKACKYGVDPLYIDDDATARVSEQHYTIGGGSSATYPDDVVSGTYAIKFYDVFGEDYLTEPIKIETDSIISGEGCNDVITALEGLPNTVIPKSSVICSASQIYKTAASTSAQSYALTFTGNPGYLKPLTIDTYLDGYRETVKPTGTTGETTVTTYNKGISGEFVDYFASKCEGVTVQFVELTSGQTNAFTSADVIATYDTYYSYELNGGYYLDVGDGSSDQEALLKKCLGDSDGNDSYGNNVEVYDWDYGSYFMKHWYETPSSHPHAIKLVSVGAADDYVGGLYYLTWYQSLTNKFIIVNPPVADSSLTESYYVYTTDGVVERVIVDLASKGQITTSGTDNNQNPVTAYFEHYSNVMYTSYDVACDTALTTVEPASTTATCCSLSTPRTPPTPTTSHCPRPQARRACTARPTRRTPGTSTPSPRSTSRTLPPLPSSPRATRTATASCSTRASRSLAPQPARVRLLAPQPSLASAIKLAMSRPALSTSSNSHQPRRATTSSSPSARTAAAAWTASASATRGTRWTTAESSRRTLSRHHTGRGRLRQSRIHCN